MGNDEDYEKVLGTDSGDGYTISWTHLMPLNCIHTNGWMINIMSHIFYHNLGEGKKKSGCDQRLNRPVWIPDSYNLSSLPTQTGVLVLIRSHRSGRTGWP